MFCNVLFGSIDILVEPERDWRIFTLRWLLIGATVAIWRATYIRASLQRAVPITVLALGLACIQVVGPSALHGDLKTPVVLTIALTAAVSTAVPWGVGGQLAAIVVALLTVLGTSSLATGSLAAARHTYPVVAASVAFALSLYAAAFCRRFRLDSIARDAALRRSARELEASEAQIRHQLIQLDSLYRTAPLGLALLDADLRYVRINDMLATMNGQPAAAHLGQRMDEVVPPLAAEITPLLRRILATGEPVLDKEFEGFSPLHRDSPGYWRTTFWPIFDSQGKVMAVSCIVQDVTEQHRAAESITKLNADLERRVHERTAQLEAANRQLGREIAERQQAADALSRSQQQLVDILDNTAAVIFLKDTEGRYVLINARYEELFHISRTEILGKNDYDLFPRDTAESLRDNDRQVLETNRALSFEELVPQDGSLHTYVSVKFPLHDPHGVAYGVCGIATDITPRKEMEAQLRASEAQLSSLVDNTSDAIWSIDRDFQLVVVNRVAAAWFEEAYGKPLQMDEKLEARAPAAESMLWRPLYTRALGGERLVFEREYLVAGRICSYLISMTPIVTAGEVTGATVYAKDITDLKRAEERAREHQAELSHMLRLHTVGEMAAGLAHEINQPLGAITNYAQGCRRRLQAGGTTPEELLPVLEEISAQALRAGEIIRRLRRLVEKGAPTCETVDLNAVVIEAVHVVEAEAAQQGVPLGVELASGSLTVDIDPIQIEQVVVNLMLNGLDAMREIEPGPHRLSLSTLRAADGGVEVTVADTGRGLSPEVGQMMFEPFFSSKASGLGMGLAISRSIVEGHGGRIWADNNRERGATVYVWLPARAADA